MLGADHEEAAWLAATVVAPLSRDVVRTGGVGTGHAMKALNNFVAGTSFVATSEALIAGECWGLAPEVMVRVINTSTGRSFSSENVMPTVPSGEFLTGFALGLLHKDVGIAAGVFAQAVVDSEVCDVVRARLALHEHDPAACAPGLFDRPAQQPALVIALQECRLAIRSHPHRPKTLSRLGRTVPARLRGAPPRRAHVRGKFCGGGCGKPLATQSSRRKGETMAKSSARDRSEGVLDRIGGAVMELVGKLTGSRKRKGKGKAARLRGRARSAKGRGKRNATRASR